MTARHASLRRPPRGRIERLRRFVRYRLLIPVFRSPHPPEYTARGVALGVFWGVTPFMGLQTLLTITTWQIMKRAFNKDASLVQAFIWAWVNNPVTMLPLYYTFYVAGLWMTGASASVTGYAAFAALWDQSQREPTFLAGVLLVARRVGLALSVGCFPFSIAFSWVAYNWALAVTRARRRRITRAKPEPADAQPL